MSKPVVAIYINPEAQSTKILRNFIAKHIDQINQHLFIKLIKVTKKNVQMVKKKGIDSTPTLVHHRKKFVSLEKIIKILTPPAEHRDHYGYGNTSSDDLVHQYHSTILDTGDDNREDDELDPGVRESVIRQKMAAFQKRRPQMEGVEKQKTIKGGRKVKAAQQTKSKFDNDDDFFRATGVGTVKDTPSKRYMEEADGDLILEDYFLEEAMKSGKKVGKTVSKRR